MATLTAKDIADILDPNVVTTYPEQVEVNAALLQNDERRKYPSIDVQNITGDENLKDFPTKSVGQTFLVHLFYRYRTFGESHEPTIKEFEDQIFDALDQNTAFNVPDTKVSVSQSWRRESETFPVRRSHSILTVTTVETEATDDIGIPGDTIQITFSGISGAFEVISLAADERNVLKQLDLADTSEEIFTKIYSAGILAVEIEVTNIGIPDTETQLENLVEAGNDITVVLIKQGLQKIIDVNLTSMVSSAERTTVQSTLVTMDVKNIKS